MLTRLNPPRHTPRSAFPLLFIVAAALPACRSQDAPPQGAMPSPTAAAAPGTPERGADTLVIGVQSDASSFVSVVVQSATDQAILANLFLALESADFDCRIKYTPAFAESYDLAPDGLSLVYHLQKTMKWSDGTPMTARDVQFTYDLVADPKVSSPRLSYIENIVAKDGHHAQIIDDHTVKFEFSHAYDPISQIAHTGLEVLPEHVLGKVDRATLRGSDFDKDPVVSGPWKLGKWEKNSSLTLVPNEHYNGANKPTLKRIVLKVIPEYATRLIELESGSVDMIEALQNMDDVSRLKKTHPEIKLYRRGWRFMDYIVWNSKNPLFASREVRRALTMAIDRHKMIKDLLTTDDGDAYGVESTSWISPALCDYRNEGLKPLPVDVEKAKAALAAEGWKDTNGDGILDKGGKPFRFSLLTNSGNARRQKATIIAQANLKAIGVDAQLDQVESNTFFERLRKKEFEAALSGWSAGLFIDPTEMWHSDTATKKYEFNFPSYANPKADALMEQGMKTADPAAAAKIWQELQQVIYDDQPYTFLYWRDEVVPLHSRVQGAKVNILSFIQDVNEWWVPKDKVKFKM